MTDLRYRLLTILLFGVLIDCRGFLAAACGGEAPGVDQILQMEKQLIESRRAIHSGQVVLKTVLRVFKQAPETEGVTKTHTTYFEGSKIRCDIESDRGEGVRQSVWTESAFIRSNPASPEAAIFGPKTRSDSSGLPDPRRLGLICWSYDAINTRGYEEILLNPNRHDFKIEAGSHEGEPVWKVSFRYPVGENDVFGEYWLSEHQGGLPVYIEVKTAPEKEPYSRSITTKLEEYEVDQVWFPSEVVFRVTENNEVVAEQVITVEEAVFGKDIADDAFTLAGLGLPKGRAVRTDDEYLYWDGNRLRDRPVLEEPSRTSGPRLLIVAVSVLLAVVGAVLLWYRQHGRSDRGNVADE